MFLDATLAHGLAVGNLFLWLIPLVWGWFAITTQFGRRKRTDSLLKNDVATFWTINNEGDFIQNEAPVFKL